MTVRKLLPYLALGAFLYWWVSRRQSQTPEQLAYQKSLPSDLYL
jgi:hypothetical protein